MAVNIGPKIGIDGEAEYRRQINNIIQQAKTLNSQMKLVSAGFDDTTSAQEKAAATSDILSKQIVVQKQRISALENMLAKSADALGENDTKTLRWQQAVNEANAELTRMEKELQNAQDQLNDTADALDDVADEADASGEAVAGFADIFGANFLADAALDILREVGDELKDFAVDSLDAASDVAASGSRFEQTFGDMQRSAEKALDAISDDTKIASTRMQDSFSDIFAFSKNVGADTADALDISSRAMIVAADNAAYYDKSIEEATETLQSFLKGNYENDAALGIAATETTRNAKANELYAMSFDKLSEAQKVDVLLAMVEAGNAASGALGQAAREADSWTNVTGEAAEALRQLQAAIGEPVLEAAIPVIKSITEAVYEMIEATEADKLDENMRDIASAFDDAESQFASSRKEIEENSFVAGYYADRLNELEKAGLDTAESQKEYAGVVSALSDLMPELNLQIEEQTGLVNMSRDAILAEIEAMKQKALYAAYEERYIAALKAQADATYNAQEGERALVELEGQRQLIMDQLSGSSNRSAEELLNLYYAQQQYNAELVNTSDYVPLTMQELGSMALKVEELTDKEREAAVQLAEIDTEEARIKKTIAESTEAADEYGETVNRLAEEMAEYAVQIGDVANAEDQCKISTESVTASLEALREEYESVKESARESIDSQIGYFEQLEAKSSMSAAEIIENWNSQKAAFENYSANLQKAIDMGLDEALVQQLSDGSTQSMAILDEFVNSTDVSIGEINASFSKMSEARDTAATAMADARTDIEEEYDKMVADAQSAGVQIPAGLAAGVSSNIGAFESVMSSLGARGTRVFKQTMDIRSPSHVMYDAGIDTTMGAVNAVQDSIGVFEDSMNRLAVAGQDAFAENSHLENVVYVEPSIGSPGSGTTSNNYSYGGATITIYQQPGEDPEDLVDRLLEIAQMEISKKEASFSG